MNDKHGSNYKDTSFDTKLDEKLGFFKYPIISLAIIGGISFFIRVFYFPYNVPLILDALTDYFFNATDLSILGHLTSSIAGSHMGWSVFLSFFFTTFRFDNFLDYMTLQREIAICLSTLTIIPVYFLCKRFIDRPYAIVGTAIFSFDPRIIQNSLLAVSEPLYILLLSTSFALYFSLKRKLVYISFALVGLSSVVREEGLFVFLPMIVMFYVCNRKEKKIIFKVILCATIFILFLLPTTLFKIIAYGNDGFSGRILGGVNEFAIASHNTGIFEVLKTSIENVFRLGGWSLVPIFMILLPIGLYFFIKERDIYKITILIIIIFMLVPAFYALSGNPDTRYVYPLFPLFSVIAAFTIKKAIGKNSQQSMRFVLIIGIILLASVTFLEIKKFDYEHQREAFGIAQEVVSIAKGVNAYYPEDSYIIPAELPQKWPALESSINFKTNIIPIDGFDSLSEYIKASEKNGLTHLVVDGQKNRPVFLNDIFYHKEKYPYLTEVYDSAEHGLKYHVKIFKIDYSKFGQ